VFLCDQGVERLVGPQVVIRRRQVDESRAAELRESLQFGLGFRRIEIGRILTAEHLAAGEPERVGPWAMGEGHGSSDPQIYRNGLTVEPLVCGSCTIRERTGTLNEVAGVIQLVECQLPKLDVAGSSPVARFDLFSP
jgi:hypothetical protein